MHRFGAHWWRHRERILKRSWQTVGQDDVLLLPGDLSWATKVWNAQRLAGFRGDPSKPRRNATDKPLR